MSNFRRHAAMIALIKTYLAETPFDIDQQATLLLAALAGAMHANTESRCVLLTVLVKNVIEKHPSKTELDEAITEYLKAAP